MNVLEHSIRPDQLERFITKGQGLCIAEERRLRGGEIEPHIHEAGALSDMPEPRIAATDVKHQSLVG